MDMRVEESWRRVITWLAQHAPVTAAAIRPPAAVAEVRRTEEAIGRALPEDLLAWWRLMDGIADSDYGAGFPIPTVYMPLPIVSVRERFAELSRYPDQDCCGPGGTHATVAGQRLRGFCTATVPICWSLGGDMLMVDLRDGPRHGRITEWYVDEGYFETDRAGTAAMLDDVADQLDAPSGTLVEDGRLHWI
jgi:cell wall assembly regulator SMI1